MANAGVARRLQRRRTLQRLIQQLLLNLRNLQPGYLEVRLHIIIQLQNTI